MSAVEIGGPFFDDLEVGQVFDTAPGCTLTEGRAAQHQSIVGDRWRLALDDDMARSVAGGPVAAPSLVWNVAIGQSTLATQRVRANLFYRRLALLRQPMIGDTLRTTTTVVGLKENSRRDDRPATGLAALHMITADQEGRTVLDFYRCAMLPVRGGATGHADDLDSIGAAVVADALPVPDWDRAAYAARGTPVELPAEGSELEVATGDVVSSAPELARLTLNVAAAHHDRFVGGERLVYGGHTIAVAASQLCRALPGLATVLAWESCDHVGPVREGDTLTTRFTVGRVQAAGDWQTVELRANVTADHERPVLDWRFTALVP